MRLIQEQICIGVFASQILLLNLMTMATCTQSGQVAYQCLFLLHIRQPNAISMMRLALCKSRSLYACCRLRAHNSVSTFSSGHSLKLCITPYNIQLNPLVQGTLLVPFTAPSCLGHKICALTFPKLSIAPPSQEQFKEFPVQQSLGITALSFTDIRVTF